MLATINILVLWLLYELFRNDFFDLQINQMVNKFIEKDKFEKGKQWT